MTYSNLSNMQRMETISMLTTAAENGCTGSNLHDVAERYIWNAYQLRDPMTSVIGMAFDAEQKAGTLSA